MKLEAAANDTTLSKLEEAFGVFNQVSAHLTHSYQNLETRVAGLKDELAASNSARIRELTEKERLAAQLSTLMAALPGGVIVLNRRGEVKEMNPAARHLTGSDCRGRTWSAVLDAIAASGPRFEGELDLVDGKRVSISSSLSGDEERIVLMTDITENYRLNAQINRDKRLSALGEMAARLAHQVRTPLSSAILYLSNLGSQLAAGGSQTSDRTIRSVQGQLAQIETLVEGMLSYIKGDISAAGSFSPVRLLEEVRQATAMQVEAEGGQLRFEFSGHDGEVQGDREALFNALSNLVVNAIQASEQAPDIRVEAFAGPELLRFRVTDSGPGIDEKTRDRIFDPFFSTRPGGTGLGLAVVMSAVRAHRGEMGVRTRPEGGAEFTMTIPRSPVSPGV